jgi:hypothetical protein
MRPKIKTPHLDDAEGEARRFLERVATLRAGIKSVPFYDGSGEYIKVDGVANAAMKRASLDLSRALAALRRMGA